VTGAKASFAIGAIAALGNVAPVHGPGKRDVALEVLVPLLICQRAAAVGTAIKGHIQGFEFALRRGLAAGEFSVASLSARFAFLVVRGLVSAEGRGLALVLSKLLLQPLDALLLLLCEVATYFATKHERERISALKAWFSAFSVRQFGHPFSSLIAVSQDNGLQASASKASPENEPAPGQ